mgnify:CR=1 FL=1
MNIGKTGANGETRVASFLRKQGYKILNRNYSCRFGEIDIIAEKDGFIVFVEVKTKIKALGKKIKEGKYGKDLG